MNLLATPNFEDAAQTTRSEIRRSNKMAIRTKRWSLTKLMIGWLLTGALLITWFLFFRPQVLDGTASYVGVSGISMTPTMHSGDLAILEKQSSYHVGEVIAYRIPAGESGAGHNVIHRIVGGNGVTGFVTKGDHNSYKDFYWHPKTADVIGKVWFHVPRLAGLLTRLHSPLTLAVVVGVVTFGILAWPTKRKNKGKPKEVEDETSPDSPSPLPSLMAASES